MPGSYALYSVHAGFIVVYTMVHTDKEKNNRTGILLSDIPSVLCTLDSMRSDCRSGKNKRECCCVYHTLCVVLYILFMHLFIPAELRYTMQLYQFYMKYSIYVQHKTGQGRQMKPCHTHGGCSYIPSLTYQDGGLSDPSHGGQKLLLHYIS